MMNEGVLITRRGAVAELRFNRAERLNVLDRAMAEAFELAVKDSLVDETVRVIVLAAEGRAFVAGGDLAYLAEAPDRGNAADELIGPMHRAILALAQSDRMTVASVKGPVAGGGMSLALGCDFVVAAENTTFNLAYAKVGASPDCGATWWLPRLVGIRKAMEIAVLSDTIDAQEALRLGLVTRVVPLDDLEAETAKLAERLAKGAPAAQGHIKRLMRGSFTQALDTQLDAEAEAFALSATSADFEEGVSAFLSKRKAVFRGE